MRSRTRLALLLGAAIVSCRSFGNETETPVELGDGGASVGAEGGTPGDVDGGAPGDASTPTKLVFLSSGTLQPGPMSTPFRERASVLCATEALAAGLGARSFVPWLSGGDADAIDGVTSDGPWSAPAGARVFASRAALFTSLIESPIDRHADGSPVPPDTTAWTGTRGDGRKTAKHCIDWTSTAGTEEGTLGIPSNVKESKWTQSGPGLCNVAAAIVCFEN